MIFQLVLILIVFFIGLIIVLNFFWGSQLKVALNRLQILHQESLEKEEVLNKELERAKIQSQSEIARSKEEAKNIMDEARRNAEKISLEATEHAGIEAKKMIDEAVEKAKRLEHEILASIDEKAVGLAQELIKYTFTQKSYEALQSHLIDELIEELKKVDKNRMAVKVDHAEVLTSSVLTQQEEHKLKEILVSKLGYELTIEEKIDTSLIVGIVIKLGGLVIDGSLKNKLIRARVALKH